MENKKKSYKYKIVKRTWKTKNGSPRVRVYVYKGSQRVTDPAEIQRALKGQITDVRYTKGAREAQKAAAKAKRELKKTIASKMKINRRLGKIRMFKANGSLNTKGLEKYLKYQLETGSIGEADKLIFSKWLEGKKNQNSLKSVNKNINISSAYGMYASGGRTIQALYNTRYGIDEMAEEINIEYNDQITASDLLNLNNWNNSNFISPVTGNVYHFVFDKYYNDLPFELVSYGNKQL